MTPENFTLRLVMHAAGIEAALWMLAFAVAVDAVAHLMVALLTVRRKP